MKWCWLQICILRISRYFRKCNFALCWNFHIYNAGVAVVVLAGVVVVAVRIAGQLISATLCLHDQLPLPFSMAHRHTHAHKRTHIYLRANKCIYVYVLVHMYIQHISFAGIVTCLNIVRLFICRNNCWWLLFAFMCMCVCVYEF